MLRRDSGWAESVPASVSSIFNEAFHEGRVVGNEKLRLINHALFMRYRTDYECCHTYGMDSGLYHRILKAAASSDSPEQFFESIRTKRYTDAHLRRVLLYGMTGVSKEDLQETPAYTLVLAANSQGRAYLSSLRKKACRIPILTKPSALPKDARCMRECELSLRMDALFTTALEVSMPKDTYLRKGPVLVTDG